MFPFVTSCFIHDTVPHCIFSSPATSSFALFHRSRSQYGNCIIRKERAVGVEGQPRKVAADEC